MLFWGIFFLISTLFGQEVDPKYQKMLHRFYDEDFKTISPEKAQKLLYHENVYFLDIREKKEFQVSHIPGAMYVGYDHLDWDAINRIPRDARIIVYCSIGARSQKIGKRLLEKNFKHVENLYGGLFLWANQERPMINKNGLPTSYIHGYSPTWGKWIKKGQVVYP